MRGRMVIARSNWTMRSGPKWFWIAFTNGFQFFFVLSAMPPFSRGFCQASDANHICVRPSILLLSPVVRVASAAASSSTKAAEPGGACRRGAPLPFQA
ncbi:hypothetical protein D3C87_1820740 [compost metagenome]